MSWLLPHPAHSKLDTSHTTPHRKTEKESQFADGKEGAVGAKSYDCEEAWSSVDHQTLSDNGDLLYFFLLYGKPIK
jgi:hypothetical protein